MPATPPTPHAHARTRTSKPTRRQLIAAACLVAAAVLLAVALFGDLLFAGDAATDGGYVPYAEFARQLEAGQVATAVIGDSSVTFTLTGEGADGTAADVAYATDNPASPDFRERLLLAGVAVSSATSAATVVDVLLDVLIFAMVLVPLGLGVGKLVNLNRSTFKVVRKTGVTFDDIAGMDEVKRELGGVVDVLRRPEAYVGRGIRPVRGVILEGPPGNGKTLFARALASEARVGFIATKGADFQSALMSLGAAKIRTLFRKAARHRPCIVFIDEFDSIGERRNYAGTGVDKENNRIITAMLNEMDGFEGKGGVLVVAATNSYRSLDPALVRPGRFDLKFTVGNPDAATRAELVRLYTERAGRTLAPDAAPDVLVRLFEGLSCAAIETCLNGAATEVALRTGAGAKSGTRAETSSIIALADIRRAASRAGVTLKG